jgi:hypothetical protein
LEYEAHEKKTQKKKEDTKESCYGNLGGMEEANRHTGKG